MTFIQKQALWVSRDADGNINLHFPTTHVAYVEGGVATVNGATPDENKNVTIDVGVKKVNDVAPDAEGNVAIEDYITGASINGKTITLNFKDGTSKTLTTQDTVPTDYVSNLSISGKTITATFKDGTTQTLTIQDVGGLSTSSTITVTKSTQGAFTPSVTNMYELGDGSGSKYTQVKVPTVVAGIGAGSYTVQNLFQQLVNKSHTHSNKTLNVIHNTNCNCCDGSCFIAGTLVLMADYTWKKIEDVQESEYVIGMDGKPNRVITPYQAWLGNKRAMLTLSDGSLTWSAEHLIWMRGEDKKEFWGTYDFHQYLREHTGFIEYQGKQYSYKGLTKDLPIIVTEDMEFAHIEEGWKPVAVRMAREYDETTLVYSLLTDGSHSYIANGYIVSGFTDDTVYNYKEYRRDNVDFKNHP